MPTNEFDMPGKRVTSEQTENVTDPSTVDKRLNLDPNRFNVSTREMFIQATEQTRMALCFSDPTKPDAPIIYVNQAFVDLTGYPRDEIIGRNCRFLQGAETDPEAVDRLRAAVAGEEYTVVDILNYRKDGTPFWNAVHVGPVYDKDGKVAYIYGSQWDITELLSERQKVLIQERVSGELRHRTNNLFAVINAMVQMSAKTETDVGEFATKVTDRIAALANAHRVSIPASPDEGETDLETLIDIVLKPYRNHHEDRITCEGEPFRLAPNNVTALGLALHELATNAVKYGALATSRGKVAITWTVGADTIRLNWAESGGPDRQDNGDGAPIVGTGSGQRLIEGMLRSLRGTIETSFTGEGFHAVLEMPKAEAMPRGA